MAKAKLRNWRCPRCDSGVRAPSKPRRDDVRRYCLECSKDTGRLVERVCPALERERAARKEKTAERHQVKYTRARAKQVMARSVKVKERDGSRGWVDVDDTVKRMLRLPELRDRLAEFDKGPPLAVKIRRTSGWSCSGHYQPWAHLIVLSIPTTGHVGRVEVEELILHELVHAVLPNGVHHGSPFRSTLIRAAREWWPGIEVRNEGRTYGIDAKICERARQLVPST